nr:MAG TPA: hypothetical protein [Bacteriophage sp.]
MPLTLARIKIFFLTLLLRNFLTEPVLCRCFSLPKPTQKQFRSCRRFRPADYTA